VSGSAFTCSVNWSTSWGKEWHTCPWSLYLSSKGGISLRPLILPTN